MFFLCLKIKSKNKSSLKRKLKFINKLFSKKKLKLILAHINICNKKDKCNKISVLTSPNANKNGQEQFSYKTYSRQAKFFSFKVQKFLTTLKKIKKWLFFDTKIYWTIFINTSIIKKIIKPVFNPEKYKTNLIQSKFLCKKNLLK